MIACAQADLVTSSQAVSITAGHHPLRADLCAELGGEDSGPSPSELLCAALCACTSMTLRMYAQRKRWPLKTITVGARLETKSKQSAIVLLLRVEGELDDAQLGRLAEIAERTPVTLMLKSGVTVSTELAACALADG